jgi:POT family proton-dependent oligopeptide transporter
MSKSDTAPSPTLFGHPTGLFTLFFAEMWERFSFYGMKALLFYYMTKGFLSYDDNTAYAVLGSYAALVYMTPLFGGMIADRVLGARRAVVLGGLLMAAGHLVMTWQEDIPFFVALALLITGNGFFKPNISTIVGSLYPEESPKRDGGFTIFYMGVNLGAAAAPLLCVYVGETYGRHWGFGLATIGMLIGLAVFVAPTLITQALIMSGAIATGLGLCIYHAGDPFSLGVNVLVAICMVAAGVISCVALQRGGLPAEAGAAPDRERLRRPVVGPLSAEWLVYAGALVSIPVFALLVSGFSPLTPSQQAVSVVPDSIISSLKASDNVLVRIGAILLKEMSKPAGLILLLAGLGAAVYLAYEAIQLPKIPRQRMYVVFVLTFFSLLFWAFFEQAASSVNSFTDRNVDRVTEASHITEADVGKTLHFRIPLTSEDAKISELPLLSQEQLGHRYGNNSLTDQIVATARSEEKEKQKKTSEEIDSIVGALRNDNVLTMTSLTYLREAALRENAGPDQQKVEWVVTPENVGMAVGGAEIPAGVFQSINPIYILLFGVVFSALWGFLSVRGLEPSTPFKFALGLFQLGLAFVAFWYGAHAADTRGIVALSWLLLGYLLQTTGELCLSPVGLSMVTRLSPARLVATVMGSWFLATAFSEFLAGVIAQFTGVGHAEDGGVIPAPGETVSIYGHVFGVIAITAIASSVICFALVPVLKRWMHEGEEVLEPEAKPQPALTHS